MKINKSRWPAVLSLAFALGLSACGGNDEDAAAAPMFGTFRIVNGITDSSGLSVTFSRSTPPPTPPPADATNPPPPPPPTLTPITIDASNIAFDSASRINVLPSAYYHSSLAPAGGNVTETDYVPIYANNTSTLYTYGTTANYGSFIVRQLSDIPVPPGQFAAQLVHAASAESQSASTLCLQFVPVNTSSPTPVGNPIPASFATATGTFSATPSVLVPAGKYSINVASCSQNSDGTYTIITTVFASGPKGVALPSSRNSILQFGVLDATASQNSQYGSPITLLMLDEAGGITPFFNGQN